jgi:hypothetical protein
MVSIRAISALTLAHQAAAFAAPGRLASRMATLPSASFYELKDTDTTGAPVDFKQVLASKGICFDGGIVNIAAKT